MEEKDKKRLLQGLLFTLRGAKELQEVIDQAIAAAEKEDIDTLEDLLDTAKIKANSRILTDISICARLLTKSK